MTLARVLQDAADEMGGEFRAAGWEGFEGPLSGSGMDHWFMQLGYTLWVGEIGGAWDWEVIGPDGEVASFGTFCGDDFEDNPG